MTVPQPQAHLPRQVPQVLVGGQQLQGSFGLSLLGGPRLQQVAATRLGLRDGQGRGRGAARRGAAPWVPRGLCWSSALPVSTSVLRARLNCWAAQQQPICCDAYSCCENAILVRVG
jgi:hypothetical protein